MIPDAPLTPAMRSQILAAIGVGARLRIACGYAKADYAMVRLLIEDDEQFAFEVYQAQCRHQVRNLVKLEQADNLQASIFALERRWPGRFARPRPQSKRARKKRPPPVDLSGFSTDVLERLERAFAGKHPP